jgi:tubulin delta
MAVVTLQLGQCGNQIGHLLHSVLLKDALEAKKHGHEAYFELSTDRFFWCRKGILHPRTVLVDMENKVIHRSLEQAKAAKLWEYDSSCIYSQKMGSGNNWANGYCHYGSLVNDNVMEMVQKQVEHCDHLGGFLVLMSVAGGTGSGVGARVTESLRDEYPHAFSLNQVVWPYASGEVIIQDYNTLLTLAHIYDASDGVLVVQNDSIQKICSRLLGLKNVSFDAMNSVICHGLGSVLQPAVCRGTVASVGAKMDGWHFGDFVSHLVPHPHYRLLSLSTIPHTPPGSQAYTQYLWSGLLKHLHQMLISAAPIEEGLDWSLRVPGTREDGDSRRRTTNKSISLGLTLRGVDVSSADVSLFSNVALYSEMLGIGDSPLAVARHPHKFNKYEKCISLLSNSQSIVKPLNLVCQRGWGKHTAKSYLHQYTKYGLEESDFSDAFLKAEHILSLYQSL